MKVQLKHHYGWKTHDTSASDLASAAKQAVRDTHSFLTDDNHWMQDDDGMIIVLRAVQAEPPAITPAWAHPSFDKGGVWFACAYRAEPR